MRIGDISFYLRTTSTLVTAGFRIFIEEPEAFFRNLRERLRQSGLGDSRVLRFLESITARNLAEVNRLKKNGDLPAALSNLPENKYLRGQRRRLEESILELQTPIAPPDSQRVDHGRAVLWYLNNSLPHTLSGYTIRTHDTLKALHREGVHVVALTRIGYPLVVGKFAASEKEYVQGILYQRAIPWLYPGLKGARRRWMVAKLEELVRAEGIGVIHTTTDFTNALIVAEVARRCGIPWIYEVRGELENTWLSRFSSEEQTGRMKSFFYEHARRQEVNAMKAADRVVVLSEVTKNSLLERGVSPETVRVIPNAVEGELLHKRYSKSALREELGLPLDKRLFGSVTSLVRYEGLDDAIKALAALSDEWQLLLVGDGTAMPNLKRLASDLGLSDRVLFVGRKDPASIWKWYAVMDVFVVPRKNSEVCRKVTPLKPLMAQALDVPVVCSRLPALVEVVGGNAILCPPEDHAALAEGVTKAFGSEHLTVEAKRWVRARTWDRNSARYAAVYRELK